MNVFRSFSEAQPNSQTRSNPSPYQGEAAWGYVKRKMTQSTPIPVTLSSDPIDATSLPPTAALLRLPANSGHGHADGQICVACAAQTDVRALLFNLLEEQKRSIRPTFSRVIVDASAVSEPDQVIAALGGKLPATALRDHVVARSFKLVE